MNMMDGSSLRPHPGLSVSFCAQVAARAATIGFEPGYMIATTCKTSVHVVAKAAVFVRLAFGLHRLA